MTRPTIMELLEANTIAHATMPIVEAGMDLALAASRKHAAEECERLVELLRRLDARVTSLWVTLSPNATNRTICDCCGEPVHPADVGVRV